MRPLVHKKLGELREYILGNHPLREITLCRHRLPFRPAYLLINVQLYVQIVRRVDAVDGCMNERLI